METVTVSRKFGSPISEHRSTYLHTTFTQELVACSEGDLNNSSKLGQFLGSVGFNVGNTFEVC